MLDTRFFIAHTFPPTADEKVRINKFVAKIAGNGLICSAITIPEYVKIAGSKIGKEAAETRIRIWIKNGLEIVPLEAELAFLAGELALSHKNLAIGDIVIGCTAKRANAKVVTDDPDYQELGIKTTWYK